MKLGKLLYIMLLEDLLRGITLISFLKKNYIPYYIKNKAFCCPMITKSLNAYKINMNHIKKIPLDTFKYL